MSQTQFTIPAPQGAYGYSKYLYDVVSSFVSTVNANTQAQNTKNSQLTTQISSAVSSAAADRAAIRSEIADFETAVDASLSALQTAVDGKNAELDASLAELFTWRSDNIDEIQGEVDKAINSKVSQTAYDAVVQQLENADSAISQSLAGAIADRSNKDLEHDNKLAKVYAFVEALMETYELRDASGNVISSVDDMPEPTGQGQQ